MGDLYQLPGLAPTLGQGDYNGSVPVWAVDAYRWLYESNYYRSLLEKAKLTDPTPLTSRGERIVIHHVCLSRALLSCKLLETFFIPNLTERTQGQIEFAVSSFQELGLDASDAPDLFVEGLVRSVNIHGSYMAELLPAVEIQNLLGIYTSRQHEFKVYESIIGEIEDILLNHTDGVILNHNWYWDQDQYLFCKEKIDTLDDFRGKKIASFGAPLSGWIEGMGAEGRWLAFSDVYTAFERRLIDCAVGGARASYDVRLHKVTNYMIGPLGSSYYFSSNVINQELWDHIPDDLQQILLEEAAKSELEALRLAGIQREMGLIRNQDAGLEFVEFSPEIKGHSFNAAVMQRIIPDWLGRIGYPVHGHETVDVFNNKVSPIVGLRIEPDGSIVKVRISKGPHAGKTMDQVLAE